MKVWKHDILWVADIKQSNFDGWWQSVSIVMGMISLAAFYRAEFFYVTLVALWTSGLQFLHVLCIFHDDSLWKFSNNIFKEIYQQELLAYDSQRRIKNIMDWLL